MKIKYAIDNNIFSPLQDLRKNTFADNNQKTKNLTVKCHFVFFYKNKLLKSASGLEQDSGLWKFFTYFRAVKFFLE